MADRLSSHGNYLVIECVHGTDELCIDGCAYTLRNAFSQVQTQRNACGNRQWNAPRLIAFEILGKPECSKSK